MCFQVQIASAVVFFVVNLVYQMTIAKLLILFRWQTCNWLLSRCVRCWNILEARSEIRQWWMSLHFLLETVLTSGFKFAHSCPRRDRLWISTVAIPMGPLRGEILVRGSCQIDLQIWAREEWQVLDRWLLDANCFPLVMLTVLPLMMAVHISKYIYDCFVIIG